MTLVVQKFGGTSVGSGKRIENIADKVIATKKTGKDVVVVVSAMGGETDRLCKLAASITDNPQGRELDVLLSTGEQVTIALLAMALNSRGYEAVSFTGRQVPLQTDDAFNKARILGVGTSPISSALKEGKIPVVAGFQGVNAQGEVTTLGRGGSDTTAVAIAAKLKADECQIYTDVSGVYTADPRVVPKAQKKDKVSFEEMLELASLGAKVLQLRAVEFAGKHKVPLRVLSSFEEGDGTLITLEGDVMEQPALAGIAFTREEAKIDIAGIPNGRGIAAKIIGAVSDNNIDVDVIVQTVTDEQKANMTFTVHRQDFSKTKDIVKSIAKELGASEVSGDDKVVKVSLVGVGMRSHPGIASTMFRALQQEEIDIKVISTSEIKVSVILDEKHLEHAVRTLHSAFGLDQEPREGEEF